jgi:sulfite oxidase
MNGSPLLRPHGAPLRAIVPGYIGARSVKWLSQVSVQAGESANRFQAADYRIVPAGAPFRPDAGFPLGEVWLDSSIWRPRDDDTVVAGMVDIDGWALAGGEREIVRVDVSADGGRSWVQADLLDDLGGWAWRRWRGRIELTPGRAEIVARAWDSAASVQPADAGALWNPRGYANAACPRVVVTVT